MMLKPPPNNKAVVEIPVFAFGLQGWCISHDPKGEVQVQELQFLLLSSCVL